MDRFPLSSFLMSLESEGFRLTVADFQRIGTALSTGGKWTVTRLRNVILSLLVKNEDQRETFLRVFREFFDEELETSETEIVVEKVRDDLRALKTPSFELTQRPGRINRRIEQEPPPARKRTGPFVLAACIAALSVVWLFPDFFVFMKDEYKPTPIVKPTPKPVPTPAKTESVRIYENVPYIEKISRTPIQGANDWKWYAGASVLFFVLSVGYGIYLWRWRKIPEDKAPDWDSKGSRYFSAESVGGTPSPRLDPETLAHLADSTGWFRSADTGNRVDVPASVTETLRRGMPSLVFFRRRVGRSIVILADEFTESLGRNTIAAELKNGLAALGVPVIYGKFRGAPDEFHTGDGQTRYLEDLEADRKGYLLLIFSDGKGFHQARDRYCLESVSRWPMKAWMDPRPKELWDESAALPTEYGIPVYPATKDGVLRAFGGFLTERCQQADESGDRRTWRGARSRGDRRLSAHIEDMLGDTLALAQDCAMIQPVGFGMADAIRENFHPDLPPDRIDRMLAVPGTVASENGFRFSDSALAVLRTGFNTRRTEAEQIILLLFLLEKTDEAKPAGHTNSPARLEWEFFRERIRLEIDPDAALKRLAELAKTPLKNTIKSDMDNVVCPFDDKEKKGVEPDGIPLRKAPKNRDNKQRLSSLAKNCGIPRIEVHPIAKYKKAVWGIFFLMSILCATISDYKYTGSRIISVINTDIDFPEVIIEQYRDGQWTVTGHKESTNRLNLRLAMPAKWRVSFWGGGRKNSQIFDSDAQIGEMMLDVKEIAAPCSQKFPEHGITVFRCPVSRPDQYIDFYGAAWREVLDKNAPENRLTSFGLEIKKGGKLGELSDFGNIMLNTRSIDTLYTVASGDIKSISEVIAKIDNEIYPWDIFRVQLIVWTADGVILENPEKMFQDFGRTVCLPTGDSLKELLANQSSQTITEKMIRETVPDAKFFGSGEPVALVSTNTYEHTGNEWTEPNTDMEFVRIPGGEFQMGCGDWAGNCYSNEEPIHEVELDSFWIGRYEVTQEQWEKVMGENPSYFKGENSEKYPVENVSWNDVQKFLAKLTEMNNENFKFTLPTEAQWEYACRSGGKSEKYAGFSDDDLISQYANFCDKNCEYDHKTKEQDDGYRETAPVGTYKPNSLGLYDMSGNVWEWCADWYDKNFYQTEDAKTRNPICQNDKSGGRVVRGGAWYDDPRDLRCGDRGRDRPGVRSGLLGFRVVRVPSSQ